MNQGKTARMAREWLSVIGIRLRGKLYLLCPILLTACQHTAPQYADVPSVPTIAPRTVIAGKITNTTVLSPVTLDNKPDPAWLKPPAQLFTLGPGDKVEIELLGEPASKVTTIVGPDGKIYFNLLAGIDVWGLTLVEAKQRLEAEL